MASTVALACLVTYNMTTSTAATSSQNGDPRDVPPVRRRHDPVDEVIITEKLEVSRLRGSEHKMVNQYEFEECLGKGQHGQVWVATNTLTHQAVVCILPYAGLQSTSSLP